MGRKGLNLCRTLSVLLEALVLRVFVESSVALGARKVP